jgi:hypothetical protein
MGGLKADVVEAVVWLEVDVGGGVAVDSGALLVVGPVVGVQVGPGVVVEVLGVVVPEVPDEPVVTGEGVGARGGVLGASPVCLEAGGPLRSGLAGPTGRVGAAGRAREGGESGFAVGMGPALSATGVTPSRYARPQEITSST